MPHSIVPLPRIPTPVARSRVQRKIARGVARKSYPGRGDSDSVFLKDSAANDVPRKGGGELQGEGGCCKIYTMVGVTDLEGKRVFFPAASVFRTFCPAFLLKV